MKLGIGTYTYTWASGVPGSLPTEPLTAMGLLERAAESGVSSVQYCDNAPLTRLTDLELDRFAERASELGMAIEIGTRGLEPDNFAINLKLAQRFCSPFIRLVIDQGQDEPSHQEAVDRLKPLVAQLADTPIKLAIENHDRFPCETLGDMVTMLGEAHVGVCLDTVNSFAAEEPSEMVIKALAPLTLNLHIKDFVIRRATHQMGFAIEGCPAGEGRLNIPDLVDRLASNGRCHSAILELWTPPEATIEKTMGKESRWAVQSLTYLKPLFENLSRNHHSTYSPEQGLC